MSRLLGLLAVIAMACGAPGVNVDAELEALMEADRAFDRATAERGADGWLEFFAEDGAMIQAGVGEIRGLPEIREAMSDAFVGRTLRWQPQRADVSSSGDLGYTVGTWEMRAVSVSEGSGTLGRGMYVSIWRKQDDGSWRVVMDLGNPVSLSVGEGTQPPLTPPGSDSSG